MLLSSALAILVSPAASSAATMSFVVDEYLLLVMVRSFATLGLARYACALVWSCICLRVFKILLGTRHRE
jgi:hypothetical protein